ncbi:MAG: hypothetical protein ABH875_03180 [Candidatus Omnitrophota bacterium]
MRRSILAATVLLMILLLSRPACAEDRAKPIPGVQDMGGYGLLEGMNGKITRGVVNIVTGVFEVPAEIVRGYDRGFMNNKSLGVLAGVFSGVYRALGRTVSGAADLLTFWSADPDDNTDIGMQMNNEFAWEDDEESYDKATLRPITNKLTRGMANLFCGIAEVPGQIRKGYQEDTPALGYAKGLWYWLSREAWGARDLLTLPIPVPGENPGVPFDESWPWDAWSNTAP